MKSLLDGFSKEDKKRMLKIDVESRNLEKKNKKSTENFLHLPTKKAS